MPLAMCAVGALFASVLRAGSYSYSSADSGMKDVNDHWTTREAGNFRGSDSLTIRASKIASVGVNMVWSLSWFGLVLDALGIDTP